MDPRGYRKQQQLRQHQTDDNDDDLYTPKPQHHEEEQRGQPSSLVKPGLTITEAIASAEQHERKREEAEEEEGGGGGRGRGGWDGDGREGMRDLRDGLQAQQVHQQPASAPSSQTPGHPSFRRQRASRACETCHARKVRCDAASLGVPCTNCHAFSIECKIPTPKRQKVQKKSKDGEFRVDGPTDATFQPSRDNLPYTGRSTLTSREKLALYNLQDGTPTSADLQANAAAAAQFQNNNTIDLDMKPEFTRAPIKDAGRVAFLGESSNLSLLVHENHKDVVHYPLPENDRGSIARVNELDSLEVEILHQRGAFLLPPRALCDELVEAFFAWVAPVVPVINRTKFMAQYKDPQNPPSFLLLQSVLLAGSRVCPNPQLMDMNGSTTAAAMTFYKRAKALFDANYEDDRVTIVQSLVLMAWYWEGPEDVTKNVFYWTRLAIVVAQGSGMHRSVENSQLNKIDKRLWKRIWWTLFARDRSCAVALGRPIGINPDDSDVEMVCEEDFIEDDSEEPAKYPPDPIHVQFFLNYVKLCEIMGLVLSQLYSVASKSGRDTIDLTHSDMALADWLQNCPKEVKWDRQKHHFWAALLYANYYTTICLLHRAHMPPTSSPKNAQVSLNSGEESWYPSKKIAYHAAGMITSIVESLQAHDQIRYTPAFIVYCLFSALIMHVYQMRSLDRSIVASTEQRLQICMNALKEVSKVWLVAKMIHALFESILGNKILVERLQKAAGKRHKNNRQAAPIAKTREEPSKRKFDEMEFTFNNGTPSQQVSYERSRPQTPALTHAQIPQQHDQMTSAAVLPHSSSTSITPAFRHNHDVSMGSSQNNTRPASPFLSNSNSTMNANGYPIEPPDLFLVTRNSPNLSESFWHNFQPDQLFPAEANIQLPQLSPIPQQAYLDPQLTKPPFQHPQQQQGIAEQLQNTSIRGQMTAANTFPAGQGSIAGDMGNLAASGLARPIPPPPPGTTSVSQPAANAWPQYDALSQPGPLDSGDDSVSSGSRGHGPIVPTTLNVEDWFNFFGINGQSNSLSGAFG